MAKKVDRSLPLRKHAWGQVAKGAAKKASLRAMPVAADAGIMGVLKQLLKGIEEKKNQVAPALRPLAKPAVPGMGPTQAWAPQNPAVQAQSNPILAGKITPNSVAAPAADAMALKFSGRRLAKGAAKAGSVGKGGASGLSALASAVQDWMSGVSKEKMGRLEGMSAAATKSGSGMAGKLGKMAKGAKYARYGAGGAMMLVPMIIQMLVESGIAKGSQNRMEEMQMSAMEQQAQRAGGSTYREQMGPVVDEQLARNRQAYLGQLGAMGGGLALGEMAI